MIAAHGRDRGRRLARAGLSPAPRYLRNRQHPLSSAIRRTLDRTGLRAAFNPSIAVTEDGRIHCTIRVPDDRSTSSTWLLRVDPTTMDGEVIENLSARNRRSHGVRTNDVRLFTLRDGLYGTFNTGHPKTQTRSNSVFVQRIMPDVSDPTPVVITPRQRVEKNVMFEQGRGALHTTYAWDSSPSPVAISEDGWHLAGLPAQPGGSGHAAMDRGQGSPWVAWGGSAVSVIHEKPRLGPLRSYRGRIAVRGPEGTVSLGLTLLHSPIARLGATRRRNPRLLHCTYFAGLTALDGQLVASYGINDRDFGIARIDDLL